jgi:hypothetical protein
MGDPAFWERFSALPLQIQKLSRKSFTLWLQDPFIIHYSKLTIPRYDLRLIYGRQQKTCL